MSTTVSYKGQTLTTVSNDTKTLLTEGKYLEDDLTLTDVSGGGAVLTTKNISANGTYNASSDSADGYSQVNVAVPASAVDTGTKNITANGSNQDVVGYAAVDVAVPNSYSASDEGKVVSNGALVAQTSDTVTANDTYDTTLINSLTVNVSGGGGSGLTTIASGSFIGNNTEWGRYIFDIGNKMAKTDFYVLVWAKQGEEFAYNSNYTWVWLNEVVYKKFGYYDLSTNGHKSLTPSSYYINSNNAGTITAKTPSNRERTGVYIRNGSFGESLYNTFQIWRGETGHTPFAIYLGHSNQLYPFAEVEYEYEVVYFGTDPTNDIVDLS